MGELLKIVRTEVIGRLDDLLRQDSSLQANHYLQLSFEDRGEEVGRDKLSKVIQLTPKTNIIEVFERKDVGRRLLILGEPGSGKTTSLLKLAEELITQVEQDSTKPIPVIFELSTWKKDQQSIEQWLVEQFKDNYSVNLKISQKWIKENKILPLLDGLDELGLIRQRLAIEKINQYLQQDISRQLVVCCRWEEYKQGQVKLYQLRGAYYLQPPTESDIRNYLQRLNQQDLWQKIETHPEMRELAQKPLFLNLMMTAFQGETIVSKEQLFSNYVEEQLRRPLDQQKYPQGKSPYSDDDTKRWLTYLAGQLEADALTVFLIEKMQPYWLNSGLERLVFRSIYGLIYGIIGGLIVGLILGIKFGLIYGLIKGTIYGIVYGSIYGLILWSFREHKIITEAFHFTWQGLFIGLIIGLIRGLTYGLIIGLIVGLIVGFTVGVIYGMISGLIVGLIYGLNVEIQSREKPNQGIKECLKKTLIIPLLSSQLMMLILPLKFLVTGTGITGIDWTQSTILALSLGLGVSLSTGGVDLVQHLTLRLMLGKQGVIPSNYACFLGYTAERKLIHRIGGQYRFFHDSLRKYFASQAPVRKRIIQENSIYRNLFGYFLVFAWLYIFLLILN